MLSDVKANNGWLRSNDAVLFRAWILLLNLTGGSCYFFGCSSETWDYTGQLDARFDHDKEPRVYHVMLHTSMATRDSSGHLPGVILLFHGLGGDAAGMVESTSMRHLAATHGYMQVYLEGIRKPGSALQCGERSWNAGTCCDDAHMSGADDVGYVQGVLEDLYRRFPFDRNLVFVAGISNGASMALRVGCQLPSRIAGIVAAVGSLEIRQGMNCATRCDGGLEWPGYETCAWSQDREGCRLEDWLQGTEKVFTCDLQHKQVPVLLFNGQRDPYTAINGQVFVPLNPGGYNESYPPVHYAFTYFAHMYGCQGTPHVSYIAGTDHDHTECMTFPGCTNVTSCISSRAGHHWYGSRYNYLKVCKCEGYSWLNCLSSWWSYGPQTFSIDITEQSLDFFDKQRDALRHSPFLTV